MFESTRRPTAEGTFTGQHVRLVSLVLCIAVAAVWVGSDLLTTGIREWSASHTVASAAGLSLLLVGAGSAGYFVNSAVRRRRMDETITATGFAAIVDCLSDIDKMLGLASTHPAAVSELRTEHLDREHGRRSYRWFRRSMLPPAVSSAGESLGDVDPVVLAEVADDCVRMLMAALRGWADLLCRTDSGIQTMAALGQLRIRLVSLASDPESHEALVEPICMVCRYMALLFDRASGTMPYRAHLDLARPALAESNSPEWPTGDLTVAEARRRVEHLEALLSRVFESRSANM